MTLEQVVAMISFIAFAICSAAFVSRIMSARHFKYQIAPPRKFTEGFITGTAYPLWIFVYGMIFLQSTAFIAFPTADELSLNRRVIVFILSVIVFLILRASTLPLLGVWLGKTGIWVSQGTNGLIKFENLTYCEIIAKKPLSSNAATSTCTLIFRTKDKHFFFQSRKYTCKIAFGDIIPYLDKLPIDKNGAYVYKVKKHRIQKIITAISYALSALIMVGGIGFLISTALISPYTYIESTEATRENELKTVSPITDAFGSDGLIVVRYKHIEGINVYSEEDGQFKWSLSRRKSFISAKGDGISICNGVLKYTVGGSDRYFSLADGSELTPDQVMGIEFPPADALRDMNFEFHPLYIRKQLSDGSYRYIVSRPAEYTLFIPTVAWGLLLASLLSLYLTRLVASPPRRKKQQTENTKPAENSEETETEQN